MPAPVKKKASPTKGKRMSAEHVQAMKDGRKLARYVPGSTLADPKKVDRMKAELERATLDAKELPMGIAKVEAHQRVIELKDALAQLSKGNDPETELIEAMKRVAKRLKLSRDAFIAAGFEKSLVEKAGV